MPLPRREQMDSRPPGTRKRRFAGSHTSGPTKLITEIRLEPRRYHQWHRRLELEIPSMRALFYHFQRRGSEVDAQDAAQVGSG